MPSTSSIPRAKNKVAFVASSHLAKNDLLFSCRPQSLIGIEIVLVFVLDKCMMESNETAADNIG